MFETKCCLKWPQSKGRKSMGHWASVLISRRRRYTCVSARNVLCSKRSSKGNIYKFAGRKNSKKNLKFPEFDLRDPSNLTFQKP